MHFEVLARKLGCFGSYMKAFGDPASSKHIVFVKPPVTLSTTKRGSCLSVSIQS